MTRPQLEVAEVIRSCRDELLQRYGASLTPEQRRALDDLTACRTAALGGHVLECPECGHQEVSYNSCGCRAVAGDPGRRPARHILLCTGSNYGELIEANLGKHREIRKANST
jgi:hypothetical protein